MILQKMEIDIKYETSKRIKYKLYIHIYIDCFVGNVIQSSPDAAYLSRHVLLKSGGLIKTPALTINRLCGSGFETVCLGAESIILGKASITLCAGTENMRYMYTHTFIYTWHVQFKWMCEWMNIFLCICKNVCTYKDVYTNIWLDRYDYNFRIILFMNNTTHWKYHSN